VSPDPALTTRSLLNACAAARAEDPLWTLLVERLRGPVRGGVIAALESRGARRQADLVDELVQEVWCRLLERERRVLRLCGTADERAVHRYVRRVASRVAIDVLRAGRALKRRPLHLAQLDEEGAHAARAIDGRECPERRLIARERIGGLLGLCRELLGARARPDALRIVRLAWLHGRSSVEIAERIDGWSVAAIDSFLHRLRCRLARRGVLPAPRARSLGRSAPPARG
jgi:RNA polymerase sigma factor (sigma-70 family)